MSEKIHFVVPIPPEKKSHYRKVIFSIMEPIRVRLPNSTVSNHPVPGAVNIHFFNEASYRQEKVDNCAGIHVFMSHGMGDKKWRDGSKVKYFDYICVSGPKWVDKMIRQGIPEKKVLLTGFPKLDPLFQGKIKKSSDSKKKTVVYAPTHVGSVSCTSYPAFTAFFDRFPEDLNVLSCPHPYHRKAHEPIIQELADADVVISDGSSIIYEALALGLPVVFPDWLVKDAILERWPDTFTAQIYREGIGYHAVNFDQLIRQVYHAIDKKMPDKDRAFIEGIFPKTLRGHSGEAAATALIELARTKGIGVIE